jgi:hypothetical protein
MTKKTHLMDYATYVRCSTISVAIVPVISLQKIMAQYKNIEYPASGDTITTEISKAGSLDPCFSLLPNGKLCKLPYQHLGACHS